MRIQIIIEDSQIKDTDDIQFFIEDFPSRVNITDVFFLDDFIPDDKKSLNEDQIEHIRNNFEVTIVKEVSWNMDKEGIYQMVILKNNE